MRQKIAAALVLMLCVCSLGACGESYDAETSTVYLLKKGRVVSRDVEEFDESEYSASELESYVKESIEQYTKEHGKNTVSLEDLTVKDNKANLTIAYASIEDYIAFTGADIFSGSINDALNAGYTFDGDFISVSDQKVLRATEIINDSKMKLAVITGGTNVHVVGKVLYYSADYTDMLDDSTIAVNADNGLYSDRQKKAESESAADTEAAADREATEEVAETFSEESAGAADADSVSDDELLSMEVETEELFDFSRLAKDQAKTAETVDLSGVYTYILYK